MKRSISLPSPSLQRRKPCRSEQQVVESDSEDEEDSSSSDDSESTITDSGAEEPSKPVLKSLKLRQMSNLSEPVQSPLDLFLLAVES